MISYIIFLFIVSCTIDRVGNIFFSFTIFSIFLACVKTERGFASTKENTHISLCFKLLATLTNFRRDSL